MNKDIKRTTIHIYEGHKYDGEYIPERLINTIEQEYDNDGWVISRIYYKYSEAEGTQICDDVYTTKRRVENGIIIYEELDSNNEIIGYYKYDLDGNLLESLWLNGQKFFYTYDEKGNEIEHCSVDKNGKLLYRAKYEYDSKDNIIRSFHENEEPCSCQHYYSRDVKGNTVKTTFNDKDDYVYSSVKCKNDEYDSETKDEMFEDKYTSNVRLFDKKGNELCFLSWSDDDLIDSCRMNYFKYDDRGNWIMRIESSLINIDDSELGRSIEQCTISIREIEYINDNDEFFLL